MSVLHHVSITPGAASLWQQFMATLADGDTVVVLDRGVAALGVIAMALTAAAPAKSIRCLVPEIELPLLAGVPLPAGVARLDDGDWLALIEQCPILLEWN
jgi:hypothetical protein